MTTEAKFIVALAVSFGLACWGGYELLHAAFEPILRSLGQ